MTAALGAAAEERKAPFRPARLSADDRGRRSWPVRLALSVCILGAIAGLIALGVWQLERRAWKLDLIQRVEQRVHADPVPTPGPAEWPAVTAERDEYRRVTALGHFLNDRETYVQAVTEFGAGYWVLTPFQTERGFIVLVNRGFVPPDRRDLATRAAGQIIGETTATGLLRISEPKGGFLRANDPVHYRWHSRDVAAIAAARGLSDVAPYFIDAEAVPVSDGWPRGGLTVLAFPNNHLLYAVTWFGLALMLSGGVVIAGSERWRAYPTARAAKRRAAPTSRRAQDEVENGSRP